MTTVGGWFPEWMEQSLEQDGSPPQDSPFVPVHEAACRAFKEHPGKAEEIRRLIEHALTLERTPGEIVGYLDAGPHVWVMFGLVDE